MAAFTLPDPQDANETIADCLTALQINELTEQHREQVMKNCVKTIALLLEAGKLATAAGPAVESVFVHFIHDLNAQVEFQTREKRFADLLQKLSASRKMMLH
ncbi:hypothetical protein [Massilia sp. DWR3-1-1]|uniref:hypothetical protein n=1 Tax=Massilia sp. DWR3-1-1 TaxID=2804559 RepID=UPI003CE8750B